MSVPDMKQLYADYNDKGLEIVAVTQFYGYVGPKRELSVEEEFAEMETFRTEKGEKWPMVFGEKSNSTDYGVSGIPHWVVLDRSGKIAFTSIGYSPERFKVFRKRVEALIASGK